MRYPDNLNVGRIFVAILMLFVTGFVSCHRMQEDAKVYDWGATPSVSVDTTNLSRFHDAIDRFMGAWCIDSATTGFLILDNTEEEPFVLASYHADQLLIPASVQKILVTGAALEILGSEVNETVIKTNQKSNNRLANKLLQMIGDSLFGEYNYAAGCRGVLNFWRGKGLDMTGTAMIDGAGRRYDNFVSARQIVDILLYQTTAPTFATFYASLPVSGVSGTLRRTLNGTKAQGRIHAKTGTLAAIKTLAGYTSTINGRKLVFAFLINNYTCKQRTLVKMLDELLLAMVEV